MYVRLDGAPTNFLRTLRFKRHEILVPDLVSVYNSPRQVVYKWEMMVSTQRSAADRGTIRQTSLFATDLSSTLPDINGFALLTGTISCQRY